MQKDKETMLSAYESNASNVLVRVTTQSSEYAYINKAHYEW